MSQCGGELAMGRNRQTASMPKKYHKSSCCGPLKALRDTKTVFLTPKRYNKHSCPFYILYKPYSKMATIFRADPGFFLGRGTPLRNEITDSEVKNFKSECAYTKKKASSQGVHTLCTLLLDSPLILVSFCLLAN